MKTITLTKAQASMAEWALDAMESYAFEEDNEGYGEADVPKLKDLALNFPTSNDEMIDDFLYRLEEQLPDVADGADTDAQKNGAIRTASNLADKIRAAFPEGAKMRDMRRRDPDWKPTSASAEGDTP